MNLGKMWPQFAAFFQMAMMNNKEFVTWEQVMYFVKELGKIYRDKKPCGVYGIPRGGCVLAVLVSHELDIPYLGAPHEGCLVIDDISDSGVTLKHYKDCGYDIATMYYHKDTSVMPDFTIDCKGDDWIVFPWEA